MSEFPTQDTRSRDGVAIVRGHPVTLDGHDRRGRDGDRPRHGLGCRWVCASPVRDHALDREDPRPVEGDHGACVIGHLRGIAIGLEELPLQRVLPIGHHAVDLILLSRYVRNWFLSRGMTLRERW